jgi:hypothetical protein
MKLASLLAWWASMSVLSVGIPLFVYVAVQQNYRMSANDPQIQIAEDTAAAIDAGSSANFAITLPQVDVATSLSPIVIAYDDQDRVLESNGKLHGVTPSLPNGVLADTKRLGETKFTWQPERGVRLAAVVVYHHGNHPGYVLAARSLREVEKREDILGRMTGLAILALLALTLTPSLLPLLRKKQD